MPAQLETTHTLMEKCLVIYRRERSSVWQCRYKVDGTWLRASTKETQLSKAKEAAKRLLIKAEIRKHDNLPVVTRKFRDVAKLAIKRMEEELTNGTGKVSYKDYTLSRLNNNLLVKVAFYINLAFFNLTFKHFIVWRVSVCKTCLQASIKTRKRLSSVLIRHMQQ